ncbi:MAG: NfeD family protein [Christensenellales bacterium]
MNVMFWIWLAVIVITVIVEIITTELISIWFTLGAIIPFILASTNLVGFEWQMIIFVVVSAILILSLRKVTKKFLLRNANTKTNTDALIGQKFRLLSKTDFETIGTVKVKDLEWSAVGDQGQTIKAGQIVEVVGVSGNKLLVKAVDNKNKVSKGE